MTPLDLFLLLPVTFAIMRGYRKGIIIEVFSSAALVLAIIASMKLTAKLLDLLEGSLHGSHYLPFICYAVVFIGVYFLVSQLGNAFDKLADLVLLGIVNKIAGAAIGLIKILFMISLFFWLADRIDLISDGLKEHSFFYTHFHKFAPHIINMLTPILPFMKNLLHNIENFFDSIKADIPAK